jgi:hypothetical protein
MNIIFQTNHPSISKAKTKKHWHGELNRSLLKLLIAVTAIMGTFAWILMGQQWAWIFSITFVVYVFYEWLVNEAMIEQGSLKLALMIALT